MKYGKASALSLKQRSFLSQEVQIRLSPAHFAWIASEGEWRIADHLALIAEKLVDIEQGRLKRLIITLPPRHGKSELISKYFPAWYLGLNPTKRVILAMYEQTLAAGFGRDAQEILEEWSTKFGIAMRDNQTAIANWATFSNESKTYGGMLSVGAGGAITGKGANLFLIDDPIKNSEEAQSKLVRDKVFDWYRSTARSRLAPGGAMVIVQTRWHEDDLAGRLIAASEDGSGEHFEVVNLPAIAETDDDALGRKIGEALWPDQYGLDELESIKKASGSYVWSALYQQRPAPLEGLYFKPSYFRYFNINPDGDYIFNGQLIPAAKCRTIQLVDLAASTKTRADYFVIMTVAITPKNDILIIDIIRTKVEGPEQLSLLQSAYNRFQPSYIGMEAVSFQITAIQNAQRAGLPVKKLQADRDKEARALTASIKYEAGQIYHLERAIYLEEFERELLSFPNAKHDDQVDCIAYACLQNVASKMSFALTSNAPQPKNFKSDSVKRNMLSAMQNRLGKYEL